MCLFVKEMRISVCLIYYSTAVSFRALDEYSDHVIDISGEKGNVTSNPPLQTQPVALYKTDIQITYIQLSPQKTAWSM